MEKSYESGLHQNKSHRQKAFTAPEAETTAVYLTELELKAIEDLPLNDNLGLQRIRDIFLVGCYTALRYSDYSRLKPHHIKGHNIEIIPKKTQDKLVIPISPKLKAILKKYRYTLPKTYEQKVNHEIKEIARLANINELIEDKRIRGGLTAIRKIPKYKLIVTHTARRTGATQMYLSGIPTIDIMSITGHKTEKSFMKYIKVSKEQIAKRLATSDYFTRNSSQSKIVSI